MIVIDSPIVSGNSDAIIEKLKFILTTPKGTVILDREFGIDFDIVDEPINTAKAKITEAYIIAARKYMNLEIEVYFVEDKERVIPKVVIA